MNMREPDAARPIAESRQSRAGRHGRRQVRGRPAMGVRAWRAKGRERGLPTDQPEKSAAAHFFLGRVTFSFFSRDDDDEHNNARRPLARLDRSEARMGGGGRRRPSSRRPARRRCARPRVSQRRACTTRVVQAACRKREQAKKHARVAGSEGGGGQRASRDLDQRGNAAHAHAIPSAARARRARHQQRVPSGPAANVASIDNQKRVVFLPKESTEERCGAPRI